LSPRTPRPPLFPYTTLFRSEVGGSGAVDDVDAVVQPFHGGCGQAQRDVAGDFLRLMVEHTGAVVDGAHAGGRPRGEQHRLGEGGDRKSTRLNSSHVKISYAV